MSEIKKALQKQSMIMITNERFTQLSDELIARLVTSGQVRTASAYRSAVNSVLSFWGESPGGDMFSLEWVHKYEQHLLASGVCLNTVSFYMRILRAIYNKGANLQFYDKEPNLFSAVYTGHDTTPKRAVSPAIFGQLQRLELSGKENLAMTRDLFLLSYSLQGISFIDLAFLRKTDVKDSVLSYRRAKTGSQIVVPLSPFAKEIINAYASQTEGSPYLLPILKNLPKDTRKQYEAALRTYNRRLKKVAELCNITENLTSHVARHSWATTARQEDTPIGVISQAMGHKTEEVTQIYLACFDHSAISRANEKVLMAANLVPYSVLASSSLPGNFNKTKVQKEEYRRDKKENVRHLSGDGHFTVRK